MVKNEQSAWENLPVLPKLTLFTDFHGEMMMKSDIGTLIRQARESNNLTQDQLGELVNLDQRSISLLEKNRRKLTTQELPEFAKALEKPLFYFLGHDMDESDWNQELYQQLSQIQSPEAKAVIVKITQIFCEYIQTLEKTTNESS